MYRDWGNVGQLEGTSSGGWGAYRGGWGTSSGGCGAYRGGVVLYMWYSGSCIVVAG